MTEQRYRPDPLAAEAEGMTDAELRAAIEAIRGNSKRAGWRARVLDVAAVHALAALMAEEERRAEAAARKDHADSIHQAEILTDSLTAAGEELEAAQRTIARAAFVAEHLFQMIDQDTWRATGGDDGQGHYEGDYRAEETLEEIRSWVGGEPRKCSNPYCKGGWVFSYPNESGAAPDGACRHPDCPYRAPSRRSGQDARVDANAYRKLVPTSLSSVRGDVADLLEAVLGDEPREQLALRAVAICAEAESMVAMQQRAIESGELL